MPLVLYDLNYSGLANHGQWSYRMHLDGCLRVLTCMHITCVIVSRSVFQSVVVPLQSPPAYSLDVTPTAFHASCSVLQAAHQFQ